MTKVNRMKKNREQEFPYIKDFSLEETYYRNKPVKELTYRQWFWHHPTAYALINFGFPVLGIFMFLLLSMYFIIKEVYLIAIFGIVICFLLSKKLYKLLKNYQYWKNVTFYDLHIRDFN